MEIVPVRVDAHSVHGLMATELVSIIGGLQKKLI